MSKAPTTVPNQKRELFMGLLLGCAVALLVGIVGALATRPVTERTGTAGSARVLQVYPSGRALSTPAELPEPVRVRFLPGLVAAGGQRAAGLEAILRLHSFLALRDVHGGSAELIWSASTPRVAHDAAPISPCVGPAAADDGSEILAGAVTEDPLGREVEGNRDLRVQLEVAVEDGRYRVDARVCAVQGWEKSEVFTSRVGAEGAALRELGTWLAATVGVPDPGEFPDSWGHPPAPRGPALSTYGDLLLASMGDLALEGRRPNESLEEATLIVPEAAWLAASRPVSGERRIELLRRAATLRVGFTAALEDLAWTWLEQGRTDLAISTLDRLAHEDDRRRPVELILATGLLSRSRPADARRVLEAMPEAWRTTTAAARLHALCLLELDRPGEAARWAAAWAETDADAAEALLIRGRALWASGRHNEAAGAWRQAARLDPDWREPVVREWTTAAAAVGREEEILAFIEGLRDDEGIALPASLQELAAWAALRIGDSETALAGYDALAELEPDQLRFRLGRCIAALGTGQSGEARCEGLELGALQTAQLDVAVSSRGGGQLPGWPVDPTRDVQAALVMAPRDRDVAIAALHVLGAAERATEAEQQERLARWRVAVGAGVEAPELPTPSDAVEGP